MKDFYFLHWYISIFNQVQDLSTSSTIGNRSKHFGAICCIKPAWQLESGDKRTEELALLWDNYN